MLWYKNLPVGVSLGFTPSSVKCPNGVVKNCCNTAANVFKSAYGPPMGSVSDAEQYAIALSAAQFASPLSD
jgi:hypothetical protein